jgi:2-polyprenyl-6-methoxyphenol hydroxylase-like FAD-dependent oxidoreductase
MRNEKPMRQTSVLICGGGPVGPTASIPLSDLGIPNVVVKKRPSTTQLPRARGMNCRSVEIWRTARQGIPFDQFRAQRQPASIAHNQSETPLFAASIEPAALKK